MITKALGGGGVGGFQIDNSCLFEQAAATDLRLTWGAPTNQKIWTYSVWLKRGFLPQVDLDYFILTSDGTHWDGARFESSGIINWFTWEVGGPGYQMLRLTIAKYLDPAAWYHVVLAYNNTLATANDRAHLYVNGLEPEYSTDIDPDQNETGTVLNKSGEEVSLANDSGGGAYDGAQSECNFIDGQQLLPSDFGKTQNGVWVPKNYSGTYGNNGFHLNFGSAADLGTDVSGNDNDLTEVNLVVANQIEDTPTNNFCVMNTIHNGAPYTRNSTFSYCNLHVEQQDLGANSWAFGTIPLPKTGKWYFEVELIQTGNSPYVGLSDAYWANSAVLYNGDGGTKFVNGVGWTAYGASFTNGDIIGVAVDMDASEIEFYKNNAAQGSFSFVAHPTLMAVCYMSHATEDVRWDFDFGQLGFTYAPPSGYKRLCSHDLPPSIIQGNVGFDAVGYTGNGGTQHITDFNFEPDLVWVKKRGNAGSHNLADSVRGDNGSWMWTVYSDDSQGQEAPTFGIASLNSDGFTVGLGGPVNENGVAYISYGFKKSATYGFDIQNYTGTGTAHTEGHDLGIIPEMIMVKNLSQPNDWYVYHSFCNGRVDPEDYRLHLNTINNESDIFTAWNDTPPTSSVFTVGTADNVNKDGHGFIAYLFSSIDGFSKVFGYEGTGDVDGPFIYCGFRPRFVMLKQAVGASVGSWFMLDTERNTYNIMNKLVRADFPDAETEYPLLDCVSNGFKIRADTTDSNGDGTTYLGIAIAEMPIKYANAR